MDALVGAALCQVGAPAEAGTDREVLLFRHLHGFDERAVAGGVGGDGFFGEDVFVLLHRILHVQRAESRRRREDHEIDTAIDDLLVGVESDELVVGRNLDAVGDILLCLQPVQALLQLVGKRVGDRREDDALVGMERLRGGSGTASTASDQTDLDLWQIRSGGFGGQDEGRRQGDGGDGGSGALQEIAPVWIRSGIHRGLGKMACGWPEPSSYD